MSRRPDKNLDYFSKLERKVERVLRESGIRYKHGIAEDPVRGPEAIRLPDGTLYVPDFILPDYPGIFVECKGIAYGDWESKWEGLRELGFRVLVVIPSEAERFRVEDSCDACLTAAEAELVPEMLIRLRRLGAGGNG